MKNINTGKRLGAVPIDLRVHLSENNFKIETIYLDKEQFAERIIDNDQDLPDGYEFRYIDKVTGFEATINSKLLAEQEADLDNAQKASKKSSVNKNANKSQFQICNESLSEMVLCGIDASNDDNAIVRMLRETTDETSGNSFLNIIQNGLNESKRFIFHDIDYDEISKKENFCTDFDLPFPIMFIEFFDKSRPMGSTVIREAGVPHKVVYTGLLIGTVNYDIFDICAFGQIENGPPIVYHMAVNRDYITRSIEEGLRHHKHFINTGVKINVPFATEIVAHIGFFINSLSIYKLGSGAQDILIKKKRMNSNKLKTTAVPSEFIIVSKKIKIKTKGCVPTTKIDWSYSFEKMGHWRVIDNLKIYGKDQMGNRNQVGRTWVIPHIVGSGPIKTRLRIVT